MPDKKLSRFLFLFYFVSSAFSIAVSLLYNLTADCDTCEMNFWRTTFSHLFNYGTKFIFILFAILFTKRYLLDKVSIAWSFIIHMFLTLLLSIYSSTLLLTYEKYVQGYSETTIDFNAIYLRFFNGSIFNFFVYFTLITILYAFHYFKKQKDQEVKESSLRAQLLDSKIKALQSQLQPHFLFNALNDISSLMDIDVQKSQEAIADLSEMLRKTLSIKDVKLISLEEELSLLKKYLAIEELRYGEKLNYEIEVANGLLLEKIPPLLLQPIVENSIKHGFSYDHDSLSITIKITVSQKSLILEIANDGQNLKQKTPVFGNGISNILERVDTLYQGNYSFEIKNINDHKAMGVLTRIKIPRTKSLKTSS